jgi:hypothetical protein
LHPLEFPIRYQGLLAKKILSEANAASILGITSRGIFLKTNPGWVVFLSYESNRGPLTLNLERALPAGILPEKDSSAQIQDGNIYFPAANILINTAHAIGWGVSANPGPASIPSERYGRIKATANEVIGQRGEIGLTAVLADFLEMHAPHAAAQSAYFDWVDMRQLQRTLNQPDGGAILSQLQRFLGLGSGLTPSGDDLISGFLLAYNRYPEVLKPAFDLIQLNQGILKLAYQRTTLLSANLIECASLGEGDERLVRALDGLLCGTSSPTECAKLLLSWGSSSGCDAFVGMVLAAYQNPERSGSD